MTLTGRCRCGGVRLRIEGEPVGRRACWCRDCQYFAAGNATINLIVARTTLAIEGVTTGYESAADSGNVMRRSFCPTCGTPLFSEVVGAPDYLVVRAGALDEREAGRPDSVIWTGSAPGWACFDPAVPRFPHQVEGAPVTRLD